MDRAPAAIVRHHAAVLHVVGELTPSAYNFVRSTSHALGDTGTPQTVILVRPPSKPSLLSDFHPSVGVAVSASTDSRWTQFQSAVAQLCHETERRPVAAIHLHGLLPCLVATYALCFRGLPTRPLLLPRGSRMWWPVRGLHAVLRWARSPSARSDPAPSPSSRDVNGASDAPPTSGPVRLVDHAVDARLFAHSRQEDERPRIVAGCATGNRSGVAQFAQLAVLWKVESLSIDFHWIGPVDAESATQLKTANVSVHPELDPVRRAQLLSRAWVFVGHGATPAFPLQLVEAMALGVPCVAMDSNPNRRVITHGETGLLAASQVHLLAGLAQLIDSAELRHNLGRAARDEAFRRFHPTKVREVIHR